jgi:hypothetical protein
MIDQPYLNTGFTGEIVRIADSKPPEGRHGPIKKIFLTIWVGLILSGLSVPLVPAQSTTPSNPIDRIDLYFFYTQDCQSCQVILQSYLPSLKPMFPSLEFKAYDVGNPAHYEALERLEKRFGRGASELPVAFIGDQMLAGEKEIMEKLNPLLFDYQAKGGGKTPAPGSVFPD